MAHSRCPHTRPAPPSHKKKKHAKLRQKNLRNSETAKGEMRYSEGPLYLSIIFINNIYL